MWYGVRAGCYIECDYLACCEEEETLRYLESLKKRKTAGIPDDIFVHFDTPLTVEHEIELLEEVGFSHVELITCINGASFIIAKK